MDGPYRIEESNGKYVVTGPDGSECVTDDPMYADTLLNQLQESYAAGSAAADSEAVQMLEWIGRTAIENEEGIQVISDGAIIAIAYASKKFHAWNLTEAIRAAMAKEKQA